jgi:predicted glycoside hydrolase/deacetylase ChbG (UPF0249 family)
VTRTRLPRQATAAAQSGRDALIVINADDFGRSDDVNAAVAEAFRAGLITSASIMCNTPAFADAWALVQSNGLHGRIGVHLNLTEGRSLTVPIRSHPWLCRPSGELVDRRRTIWWLSRREARAVAIELAAQIEAVIAAGITPTHLDSHQHVHTHWPVGSMVMSLARDYGIPAVRIARNTGPQSSKMRSRYKRLFNERLTRAGLARSRWFGDAPDVLTMDRLEGSIEVMVHPERGPQGMNVDCVFGAGTVDRAEPLDAVVARLRRLVSTSGPPHGSEQAVP